MSRQLVACMLNVSEGRNLALVERIAQSALRAVNPPAKKTAVEGWKINAAVLNIFQDFDYNRSVITIVAGQDSIGASVEAACKTAYELIDLSEQEGVHPRLGAVDLVPLHPISENMSLQTLGAVAKDLGRSITSSVPGTSVFLFGAADSEGRGLVARRKEVGWFKTPVRYSSLTHDLGHVPSPRYGLTGVGAIPYMMNVNVTLDTQDVALGRRVAAAIRATSPKGLPGVQSMAFPHEGRVEVACNVDLLPSHLRSPDWEVRESLGGQYVFTPSDVLTRRVLQESGGVGTVGTTLVGFTPEEARALASLALTRGEGEAWRKAKDRRM
ncbi:formimidoyltransferase-cyclodeaminase-like [Scylla paramamosain]|uniref:formimidoyltransferase-cyclodeaminase-like n=1 Tax=Scylla paramamosain TaxID=85552 RepID=UPI0030828B28